MTRSSPGRRRVRVLLIVPRYFPPEGGLDTMARDFSRGLRARHLGVEVLVTRPGRVTPRRVARPDGVLVVHPPTRRSGGPAVRWRGLPFTMALARRMAGQCDVVFSAELGMSAFAAILAGWRTRRPVVLQGGDPDEFFSERWAEALAGWPVRPPGRVMALARSALFLVLRRADAVTCVTEEHTIEARRAGIGGRRIHYVPHGVDTQRFRPASPAERRELRHALGWGASVVAVFLGRLTTEKGIMDLLKAWHRADVPFARLVLIGADAPGPSSGIGPAARRFVRDRGLAPTVSFAGDVTDPAPLIRTADVFVQPSQEEGFPLTALKAMACGVPVVGTAVGGLRDYLVDERNALVCAPKRPDELAAALARIMTDSDLRARLGDQARRTVVERYDRDRNLDCYAEIFGRLAARRAGATA